MKSYSALGFTFGIETDVPGADEVTSRLFAPFAAPGSPVVRRYELRARQGTDEPFELLMDATSIQRVANPGSMLDWVIADVSKTALAANDSSVVVHAAVAHRDGRAVLLPAPPDHGKTTTSLGLVERGFGLLSDEAAVISMRDRLIEPFARPLMVSPDSMRLFPELRSSLPAGYEAFRHMDHHVSFLDIGQAATPSGVVADLIIAPRFEAGASTRLERLPASSVLMLLTDQCFNLARVGPRGFRVLAEVANAATCYRLTIGSLAEAADLIEGLFAERRASRGRALEPVRSARRVG
jgi:hypothetical protein